MSCAAWNHHDSMPNRQRTFWDRALMATWESTSVVEAVSTAVTFSCTERTHT